MALRTVVFCNNVLSGLLHFRGDIMRDFASKGWKVVVIVPESTVTDELLSCLDPEWIFYTVKVNPNDINPIGDFKYFSQLLKIYRKEKPDIVFQFTIKPNIYSTMACKMLHIPCVSMVAGLGYVFEGNSAKKKIGRMLYKLGLRLSNKVFVLNKSNRQTLLDGGYVKANNLIHLKGGEGVNLSDYPYRPMEFNTTRFLMVARVLYDKGYQEYVDAAKIVRKRYPDVEIELLGPLAPNSKMGVSEKQVMSDHESNTITYLGKTNDVPSYVLRDGTVMVLPSKYLEGLNRSLMEACSMGRPIITTDIPGCLETVEDGVTGFLVPKGDAPALAEAMIRIIELPKEKKIEMSRAARKRAEEFFNEENVIREYHKVVSSLL